MFCLFVCYCFFLKVLEAEKFVINANPLIFFIFFPGEGFFQGVLMLTISPFISTGWPQCKCMGEGKTETVKKGAEREKERR